MKKHFYRQKLSYKQADNALFCYIPFIWSIPVSVIRQLQAEIELSIKNLLEKKEYTAANEYGLQKNILLNLMLFWIPV
jgi:hypothetical protein